MNVTRKVIADLWPVYAAGEASADTRALIDEFIKLDPDFARVLHESGEDGFLNNLGRLMMPPLPPDHEARTLGRIKSELLGFNWLFFLALLFSSVAFGRIVSDTSWDVSPRNFIILAAIAASFWIAFFARSAWVRRKVNQSIVTH
jgi:hypothetical protein